MGPITAPIMRLSIAAVAAVTLFGCGSADETGSTEATEAQHQVGSGNAAEAAQGNASGNQVQPVDDSSRPTAPNGGIADSAADADMSWAFSRAGPEPKLAYGVPQTDNVRLMLRCPAAGEVLLSFLRPNQEVQNRPGTLVLASGNAQRTLTIETQQGPLGTSVEAELPLSSGPLQEFRSGEELEVRWGDSTIAVPGDSDRPVRQFFEACG
jgi:hypothetical protein